MAPTNREEVKAARELNVFLGFAEFAARKGLHVRPDSAVNRRPPEPDILCEVEGEGLVAFELVEIIDSTLAEDISVAARKGVPAAGAWVGDTTQERLRKKLYATYGTPHPMELVMWANPFITPPRRVAPDVRAEPQGGSRPLTVPSDLGRESGRPDERARSVVR
jgi:hypothetical protein